MRALGVAVGALIFTAAAAALHEALKTYRFSDIRAAIAAVPTSSAAASLLLAALGYVTMTGYDAVALRYVGHEVSYRRSALASFASYAIGNNAGFGNFASSSIRYRLYAGWDLSALEIGKLTAMCTLTFWCGFLAVGALSLSISPFAIPGALGHSMFSPRTFGILFAAILLAYGGLASLRKAPIRVHDVEITLPSLRFFLAQTAVSALDWTLAASALYVLLPDGVTFSWFQFLGIYVLVSLIALLSHVPGGLGVLESLIVAVCASGGVAPTEVLSSVLLFRAIYYLLPLLVGTVLLAAHEGVRRGPQLARASHAAATGISAVAPPLMAFATFLGGAILLVSGATPPASGRMALLADLLPLPVIELSHFVASIIGAALLVISRGLSRRLDGAFRLAVGLLAAGALLSLLKGWDWEEASALAVMLGALVVSRKQFYRRSVLSSEPFTAAWVLAVVVVVSGSVWLGMFATKHIEYANDMWWTFALHEHAPRFLRASVATVSLLVMLALYRIVRPTEAEPEPPTSEELARARAIVAGCSHTTANLALLGDKSLLFNESRTAFIMYGVAGRSWIAMGDPVGPADEWGELAWQFQQACDAYAARAVFYEVGPERLDIYADLGLVLFKVGEEAYVDLRTFSLEGPHHKDLRHSVRHVETKDGCSFRIASTAEVATLMPRLREISDDWLARKNAKEKRFSLGCFQPDYIARFPCALVERQGHVVAFANVWLSGDKEEVSIDLMRHTSDAPHGVMDYLFVQLMLWAKAQGCHCFNLGMAPLSGLDQKGMAAPWTRVGTFVYNHGEHFYNFEGLRHYKEKFGPQWKPAYLACPSVWHLPQIFADLSHLVSGGVKGALAK